jgi:hypothetical protein
MSIINEIAESLELTESDNRYWSAYLGCWVTVPDNDESEDEVED